jgi:putative nucleotidyltransferase with HDIG domain
MQGKTEPAGSTAMMPVSGRDEIIKILQETGSPPSLIDHVSAVCDRALKIAEQVEAAGLPVDTAVVEAGALLHDSGIPRQKGEPIVIPEWGDRARGLVTDNLTHPILGFELAGEYGFPLSVRRCILCHTPGPTREECRMLGITPPEEELIPITIEEKIVMYADFLIWATMLDLNPWRDPREMADAGIPYFNYFWRKATGTSLTMDGPVAQRWIDAQRDLGRFARPEWFGIQA